MVVSSGRSLPGAAGAGQLLQPGARSALPLGATAAADCYQQQRHAQDAHDGTDCGHARQQQARKTGCEEQECQWEEKENSAAGEVATEPS
jgi:hypothetical protein